MTPDQLADLAESMVPVAADLTCRVRDGDADGIARLAQAKGWDTGTVALLIVLAAMVPDDAPVRDLLAWTDTLDVLARWRQQPLLLPAQGGRRATEPCGTYAAARRHQRHREPLDAACARALSEKRAEYSRDRRERARRAGDGQEQQRQGEEAA